MGVEGRAKWTRRAQHAQKPHTCIGVQKEKEERARAIESQEEIMAKNFQNLMKDTQVQKVPQTSSITHVKKAASKQTAGTLQKIKA